MLRLDFESFQLAGTGGSDQVDEGICVDEFFVTVGPEQATPLICGENTGQHCTKISILY